MRMIRRHFAAALMLGSLVALPAAASDKGTKDEAKTLNDAAVAHIKKVGPEQAMKDFATDKAKWMPKDLYPFVLELTGIMRYHISPALVGKQTIDIRDANGREFCKEMVNVAKTKNTGWVDYEWAHPVSKKVEDKTAYVQRVSGTELLVGVGIYR